MPRLDICLACARSDVVGTERERDILWAQLKSQQRSVEKVYRTYKGDVSRLVDLCRHMIVFEDLADVVRCVDTIAKDPDIVIDRVKNRFDQAYKAAASAGYRDVLINMRIVNNLSVGLGIEVFTL
jgi:hypothetical protein